MVGAVVGGYQIIDKLGEGGMGVVYKALDLSLGRVVALKAVTSDLAHHPELEHRFRAEARAQASLNQLNLATIHAFLVENGCAWMVMEFVDGETVASMIQRRGPIPWKEAVPMFRQALMGLGHAHRAGIVHRDIKPGNLMVNREGIVKVMDFGIAKVLGERGVTGTKAHLGTAAYMAPEQVRNAGVDARTDIYALGVTLYEMLCGHVPFEDGSDFDVMTAHVNTAPPPPTRFYPHIPPAIEEAVLRALAKNPQDRFQTTEEFGVALEKVGESARPFALPAPPPEPQSAPAHRMRPRTLVTAIVVGSGLVILLALQGITTLMKKSEPDASTGAAKGSEPGSSTPDESTQAAASSPLRAQSQLQPGEQRVNPKDREKYFWIPAGTFSMGCSTADIPSFDFQGHPSYDCGDDELPIHNVTLSRGFWVARVPVTYADWRHRYPEHGGPDHPGKMPLGGGGLSYLGNPGKTTPANIERRHVPPFSGVEDSSISDVSWYEASLYCEVMGMRLPAEAEWERAARMHAVNESVDFVRMEGLLWQWTADWYDANYYKGGDKTDPTGPSSGTERVLRGVNVGDRTGVSSWLYRISRRSKRDPSDHAGGFRCVADALPTGAPQSTQ